jgi:TolA-binding protein
MKRSWMASLLVVAACSPAATTTSATPKPATTATTAETEATDAPTTTEATTKPSGAGLALTEEKLHAAQSLQSFPNIEDVTKEIGAPFAKGKTARKSWWFEKRPLSKTWSCDTIDLVKGPNGAVAFETMPYTGPDAKAVTTTKKDVLDLLNTLGDGHATTVDAATEALATKKFDDLAASFEKKLGKAHDAGDVDFAAWKYRNEDSECHVLVVTKELRSQAGVAMMGLPCP